VSTRKPLFDLKPLEFLSSVKYGGAVGKILVGLVSVALVLAVAAARASDAAVQITIVVVAALVLFAFFGAVIVVLKLNPALALLEGAELVNYRRMEMEHAAKGTASIPNTPLIPDPNQPPKSLPPGDEETPET
jgi:hypothetical protein